MSKSVFETLNTINLSSEVKAIQGNNYLPWNKAWAEVCKVYPTATYEFHEYDGIPFRETSLGLFVKVSVTINEITHSMVRPVYDHRNLGMKTEPYEKQYGKKKIRVEAATANDINDSLMRCFTKAIAMHGLGLYIFQDKAYADAELLDSSQVKEIVGLIADNNLRLADLNATFGVNKLMEIHAANYDGAIQWIEDNKK